MLLKLNIPDATEDELRKGLAAARRVFDTAGVHPVAAAEGWWALEGWDDSGFASEISEEDDANAAVWADAQEAAIAACCEGWDESRKPKGFVLEIIPTADTPDFDDDDEDEQ